MPGLRGPPCAAIRSVEAIDELWGVGLGWRHLRCRPLLRLWHRGLVIVLLAIVIQAMAPRQRLHPGTCRVLVDPLLDYPADVCKAPRQALAVLRPMSFLNIPLWIASVVFQHFFDQARQRCFAVGEVVVEANEHFQNRVGLGDQRNVRFAFRDCSDSS